MTGAKALIVMLTFAYCMALYPSVLRDTVRRGMDAPIYWEAGRGNLEYLSTIPGVVSHRGWVYSDRLLPVVSVVASLPYPWFLFVLHLSNSIGVACVMAAVIDKTEYFPLLAWGAAFVVGAKASDFVANGNVTAMLCGLSLNPWGAVLATAVKPWYGVVVVLHAAAWAANRSRTTDEGGNEV